ncbi:MAG: hypothetical protein OXB95_09970, partial [Rhodobacteraceae bacterium]|nr:hypothetical protein [Paracoccaceae bacterium]
VLPNSLERAAVAAGLGSLHARLLPTLEARGPKFQFCEMIAHLLMEGAVVALDEFHHAKGLGMEGDIKRMIDRFKSIYGPKPPGELILMGSHQQQVLNMFRCDQPLHGRASETIRLRQWGVWTVLEMAAEHGFLACPRRFLTLWTAYGGMPNHWERFVSSQRERWRQLHDFCAWNDETVWRAAFVKAEREHLDDEPADRYDNRSYVELAEPHREVLLHLAGGRRRGYAGREFPQRMRRRDDPSLKQSLEVLSNHLELIEENHDFHGLNSRWRMADNNTQFQVTLTGGRTAGVARGGHDRLDRTALQRLETHEGAALEKLTAGWLGAMPDVDWNGHGVWLGGLADIDALAIVGTAGAWTLTLAGCKRNAGRHQPERLKRQFEDLLVAAGESEEVLEIRRMPRRLLLVSPVFTTATFPDGRRVKAEELGFECVGIREMALQLGIDPGPLAPNT